MQQPYNDNNDYLINNRGNRVPKNLINTLDLIRDEEVKSIVFAAEDLQAEIKRIKELIWDKITSYIELAYDTYQLKPGGQKGNVTLMSYDNQYKVSIQINESFAFNEQLQVARQILIECLREWTEDGRDELKFFVEQTLHVDKQGNVNRWQIMRILKFESKDPRFQKAQLAIKNAIMPVDAKEYIRIHKRNKMGHWEYINLNFASL